MIAYAEADLLHLPGLGQYGRQVVPGKEGVGVVGSQHPGPVIDGAGGEGCP